jgi:hypothetical protein
MIKSLSERQKQELIKRYELFVLRVVDLMSKLSIDDFIQLGGMEFLLLFYEKHKLDESNQKEVEEFLVPIGNSLGLASLQPDKYKSLFVQSGWLKRLNEMCKLESKYRAVSEMIAHRILYNLNNTTNNNQHKFPILYANMVYPLYPLYSMVVKQIEQQQNNTTELIENHNHVVDVVFIHGLRGSVFKTWRQSDPEIKEKKNKKNENQEKSDQNTETRNGEIKKQDNESPNYLNEYKHSKNLLDVLKKLLENQLLHR